MIKFRIFLDYNEKTKGPFRQAIRLYGLGEVLLRSNQRS